MQEENQCAGELRSDFEFAQYRRAQVGEDAHYDFQEEKKHQNRVRQLCKGMFYKRILIRKNHLNL